MPSIIFGDVNALTTIRPLLKSENPTIRGGAVEAVRLMETQEADEIIARHINHEKEPAWGVRVSAVKAASTRSKADPIMSALLKAASDDPELKAKKEVRKLLFSWSRDNPELTAKLEEIAEADERAEEGNL